MHAYTFFSYFLFSSFDYFGCNFGTNKSLNSVCVITEVVATKGFSNHQFNRLLLSIGRAADTKHAAPAHLRHAIFTISFKKLKCLVETIKFHWTIVQFWYFPLYSGIDSFFCRLLLLMPKMDIDWNLKNYVSFFKLTFTYSMLCLQKRLKNMVSSHLRIFFNIFFWLYRSTSCMGKSKSNYFSTEYQTQEYPRDPL